MDTKLIETELVKANITEQVIAKIRADYLPLTVKDSYDKPGFQAVTTARKEVKKLRVGVEKICKAVREPAVAFQKAVIAKEKEIVSQLAEVEGYLQSQEDIFNAVPIVPEVPMTDDEKVNMYIEAIKKIKFPEVTEASAVAKLARIKSIVNAL